MPTCPAGHDSATSDFCDTCGIRIDGAGQASGAAGTAGLGSESGAETVAAEQCPQCGTGRTGRFCENCGFDFTTGAPAAASASGSVASPTVGTAATPTAPAPDNTQAPGAVPESGWTAVAVADRGYFDAMMAASGPDAAEIEFPSYYPDRRFRLSGPQMRIGRRSVSRGIDPEIDLTGPPTDPGISHLHAVLVAQPDGSWSVVDPGSSNGTQVNDAEIETGVAVPLKSGDRIGLGAWTVLTVREGSAA
jgi:hypothetical protein